MKTQKNLTFFCIDFYATHSKLINKNYICSVDCNIFTTLSEEEYKIICKNLVFLRFNKMVLGFVTVSDI